MKVKETSKPLRKSKEKKKRKKKKKKTKILNALQEID